MRPGHGADGDGLAPAASRRLSSGYRALVVATTQWANRSRLLRFVHMSAIFSGVEGYNTGLHAEWVMMSSDNDKVFSQAMSDVVRLKREPRVDLTRNTPPDRDPSLEHRRRAAAQLPELDRNQLTENAVAPLDAWFVLDFKRPGVQNGVFRKLKQGRYEIQSRLDLHRMTV